MFGEKLLILVYVLILSKKEWFFTTNILNGTVSILLKLLFKKIFAPCIDSRISIVCILGMPLFEPFVLVDFLPRQRQKNKKTLNKLWFD